MDADRIVKDWFLIRWWDEEMLIGKTLYGTLVQDNKGRFRAGVEVKSSPLDKELTVPDQQSRSFQTLNSVWECVGPGKEIDESHYAIPFFNAGVRPPYEEIYDHIAQLENKGYIISESEFIKPKRKP